MLRTCWQVSPCCPNGCGGFTFVTPGVTNRAQFAALLPKNEVGLLAIFENPPGVPTPATGLLIPVRPWLLPHRSLFCVDKASWGKSREIRGLQASSSSSSSLSVMSQDPGRLRADYIMDADVKNVKVMPSFSLEVQSKGLQSTNSL